VAGSRGLPHPQRRRPALGAALLSVGVVLAGTLVGTSGASAASGATTTSTSSKTHQFSSPAAIARAAQPTKQAPKPAPAGSFVSGPLQAPGGPFLYDRAGRVVLLHGVNAVYKLAPFELYPDPGQPWNFSATDAQRIASLGFTVVRLGILWEGVEPGSGGPNQASVCTPGAAGNPNEFNPATAAAYLAKIKQTVDLLGRYHVYSLLDMHQDVYSQPFRGEGAPEWAICTNNVPIVPLGGRWSSNYGNPTLQTAEEHFWMNDVTGGLQQQYDLAWTTVAKYFADNAWVVGYDPYNEPFEDMLTTDDTEDFATKLECFYTGTARPGTLLNGGAPAVCPSGDPAQGLIPSIQSVDPHHLIFVEADNYSVQSGGPSLLGPMGFPNLVYNFHVYCGDRSGVTGDPIDLDSCASSELRSMARRQNERPAMTTTQQPGGPAWFMTEFGATSSVPLLDQVTSFADGLDLGWIYWAWKYYDDPTGSSDEALVQADGTLAPTAAVLSRPYPQAVAGTPISNWFELQNKDFQLVYTPSVAVKAPTVVFVPGNLYPQGYCTTVRGGRVMSAPGAAHLLVKPNGTAPRVTVTLRAGNCPS
jgi:endoglycosylceramidase